MILIFLDIDGVLNDHTPFENGYCRIDIESVKKLNRLLAIPSSMIVLSSAWRYTVNTISAIETLLCIHGANAFQRIHGMTESDEDTHPGKLPPFGDREGWTRIGLELRSMQINKYVDAFDPVAWVVLDDLNLPISNLVKTNPMIGLTDDDVRTAIDILSGKSE